MINTVILPYIEEVISIFAKFCNLIVRILNEILFIIIIDIIPEL